MGEDKAGRGRGGALRPGGVGRCPRRRAVFSWGVFPSTVAAGCSLPPGSPRRGTRELAVGSQKSRRYRPAASSALSFQVFWLLSKRFFPGYGTNNACKRKENRLDRVLLK